MEHKNTLTNPEHGCIHRVACEVINCRYNEQSRCTAKEIHVGPQYAAVGSDTICTTFKPR